MGHWCTVGLGVKLEDLEMRPSLVRSQLGVEGYTGDLGLRPQQPQDRFPEFRPPAAEFSHDV